MTPVKVDPGVRVVKTDGPGHVGPGRAMLADRDGCDHPTGDRQAIDTGSEVLVVCVRCGLMEKP